MIINKIDVYSITEYVKNPIFDEWDIAQNPIAPTDWGYYVGNGELTQAPSGSGYYVKMTYDAATPYIIQGIQSSELSDGTSYTLQSFVRGLGRVVIYEHDGITEIADWYFLEDFIDGAWQQHNITFTYAAIYSGIVIKYIPHTREDIENEIFGVDYVHLFETRWYEDTLSLDTKEIKSIENFKREIEDDMFTFISDNNEMTIRNYGNVSGYFNPENFITNYKRIYRFDITMEYKQVDGTTFDKTISLFANNDNIKRVTRPESDDIIISMYELSTLLKDNGWFLGDLQYELNADGTDGEGFYFYRSDTNEPLTTVLSNLQVETKKLLDKHLIPYENLDLNNNITSEDNASHIYFPIIDNDNGKYIIVDWVKTPQNRVFLLVMPYDQLNSDGSTMYVWEIINGSTLQDTGEVFLSPNTTLGKLGDNYSVGFAHTYNADHYFYSNYSYEIEFIIMGIYADSISYYYQSYIYTNNNDGYFNTEFDLKKIIAVDWATASLSYIKKFKCLYVDSAGLLVAPVYSEILDNMIWINNVNNREIDTNNGFYTITEVSQINSDFYPFMRTSVAYDLDGSIYRFLREYTIAFKNITLSEMMKELCITQDAVWYMSYVVTGDIFDIEINIKNRNITGDGTTIPEENYLTMDTAVKKIKFSDLQSRLFNKDIERLRDYVTYYNYHYGYGKKNKIMEFFDYQNNDISDVLGIANQNDSSITTHWVNTIEFDNNEKKTYMSLIEVN